MTLGKDIVYCIIILYIPILRRSILCSVEQSLPRRSWIAVQFKCLLHNNISSLRIGNHNVLCRVIISISLWLSELPCHPPSALLQPTSQPSESDSAAGGCLCVTSKEQSLPVYWRAGRLPLINANRRLKHWLPHRGHESHAHAAVPNSVIVSIVLVRIIHC